MKILAVIFLYVLLFITGAMIMLIELVGARMISPYFGAGIYVWAGLISVTLASLALGYFLGGYLIDRKPVPAVLAATLLCAALSLLPVPFIAESVMIYGFNLCGLAVGTLLSGTVLFFVPLFLLGMVAPMALRTCARSIDNIGKISGRLYAVSTAGSLAGTLVTGFILIPNIGNRAILLCATAILMFTGLMSLVINRSGIKSRITAAILFLLLIPPGVMSSREGDSIYSSQSMYGQIDVIDKWGERFLLIDGNIHSHITMDPTQEPIQCEYVRRFELLPEYYSEGTQGLCLGTGAGLIPEMLIPYGIRFDVVDIDPEIPVVAKRYFNTLQNGERIYIQDGRSFLRSTDRKYDFIVVDPSSTDSVAYHLYSREFFCEIREKLTESGVMAINAMGTTNGQQLQSVWKTVASVFKYQSAYKAHEAETYYNAVIFASDKPLDLSEEIGLAMEECSVDLSGSGVLITDDYNPIDVLSAPLGSLGREGTFRIRCEGEILGG